MVREENKVWYPDSCVISTSHSCALLDITAMRRDGALYNLVALGALTAVRRATEKNGGGWRMLMWDSHHVFHVHHKPRPLFVELSFLFPLLSLIHTLTPLFPTLPPHPPPRRPFLV